MLQKKHLAMALTIVLSPTLAFAHQAVTGGHSPQKSDQGKNQQNVKKNEAPTNLKTVTVTGSLLPTAQVATASPVITINSSDIKAAGLNTIQDVLLAATVSTGDVDTELDMVGSTPNGHFVNLKGLGPQYTLVLLNGKRMADFPQSYQFRSTAVSLNSIPVAAIDRIEILSGGASAIYGSDAVAGVINIITKKNYNGHEFHMRAGTTTRGGGNQYTFEFTGGKSKDKWNITYALQYQRTMPILASQRDFTASTYANPAFRDDPSKAPPRAGVYLRQVHDDGTYTYLWRDASGALSPSTSALEYACKNANPRFIPYRTPETAPEANRCGDPYYVAQRTLRNGVNAISGVVSGNYNISDRTQVYYTFTADKERDTAYNYTELDWYMSDDAYDPAYGPIDAFRVYSSEQIGGQVPIKFNQESYNLNVGMRGEFLDRFNWDLSFGRSVFKTSIDRRNFVTQLINGYYLGDSLGTTSNGLEIHDINIDHLFSPLTKKEYYDLSTVFTNRGDSSITNIQAMARGELFDLPAGPLQMAVVLTGGNQKYVLTPDIRTTPGYTGNRIFNWTAVNAGGSRDHYALGTEFRIPATSTLTADIAGRYDRYHVTNSTSSSFTWQAGLEWRPISTLLLRANYATSFRAPDLTYLFTQNSTNFYSIVDLYRCRLDGLDPSSPDCVSGSSQYQDFVQGTYQGNPSLENEEGKSLTAGFVWDATDSMLITVDYYRIRLSNAVSQINDTFLMTQDANCLIGKTVTGEAVDQNSPSCDFYTGLVTRDTAPGSNHEITGYSTYPINQASLRTAGIDSSWRYQFHAGSIGDFSVKLGYTIVTNLETQLFPGDQYVDERDNLQYSNFRSKANWQISWNRGQGWRASIYGYRWGSLPNYAKTGRIGPYIIWNFHLGKQITRNLGIGLQVNNLFDNIHPRDDTYTGYPYFGHSYSPIGRQIFGEITYDF